MRNFLTWFNSYLIFFKFFTSLATLWNQQFFCLICLPDHLLLLCTSPLNKCQTFVIHIFTLRYKLRIHFRVKLTCLCCSCRYFLKVYIGLVNDTCCKYLPSREQLSLFLRLHNQSKVFVRNTVQWFCLRSRTVLSKE